MRAVLRMIFPGVISVVAAIAPGLAHAQENFPAKPIRMVVPFTPGSATDLLARTIGPKMLDTWGQQVVVDNRPGAGSTVGTALVAKANPDGYTLLLNSSAFAGSAALYSKLPYDTVKDFSGVTLVAGNPLVLVVPPSLGVKTTKELIALIRSRPGKMNFASSGIGSGTHYGNELFKLQAGLDAVHVPYRGTPETITDTVAGRVQYAMPPILAVMPMVREGRLIALAVTTKQRAPMLPDVPTLDESALPGFEYDGWFGVMAPSRTPPAIISKLNAEIVRIVGLPDVKERIAAMGGRSRHSTPAELDQLIRSEIETRRKVFQAAGVKQY